MYLQVVDCLSGNTYVVVEITKTDVALGAQQPSPAQCARSPHWVAPSVMVVVNVPRPIPASRAAGAADCTASTLTQDQLIELLNGETMFVQELVAILMLLVSVGVSTIGTPLATHPPTTVFTFGGKPIFRAPVAGEVCQGLEHAIVLAPTTGAEFTQWAVERWLDSQAD